VQLTEQQRVELERRGWKVTDYHGQFWQYVELTRGQTALRLDKLRIEMPRDAHGPSLRDVAEIAAILGIAPPGYRLVPEEVAEKALPHVRGLHQRLVERRDRLVVALSSNSPAHNICRDIEEAASAVGALASALQGKEVEKR